MLKVAYTTTHNLTTNNLLWRKLATYRPNAGQIIPKIKAPPP
nr:MAG TPA: hypothetical protein [Caudoviricetes sp.]